MHFETLARLFQSSQERVFHVQVGQKWKAMVTTECQEVGLSGIMEPLEAFWHSIDLHCWIDSSAAWAFSNHSEMKRGR
jgi:hypothetical protein